MLRAQNRVFELSFEDDNDEDELMIFVIHHSIWIWERTEDFNSQDE